MRLVKKKQQNYFTALEGYDYYLGLDWSQEGYSLGVLKVGSNSPHIIKGSGGIEYLKEDLRKLKGRKIIAIEETTSAHWLFVELKDVVEKIVVCDPRRNRLLREGAKNDDIDAGKLSLLLKNGLLKETYHIYHIGFEIRKLVKSYYNFLKIIVQFKNQRSALYRGEGLKVDKKEVKLQNKILQFIDIKYINSIDWFETVKKEYLEKFNYYKKNIFEIKAMCDISGIGLVGSITIYSSIIDATRFSNKHKYWAYCGLAKHPKDSGGKSYGKRRGKYSSLLKGIYISAARIAIKGKNDIREYYEELLAKGMERHKAIIAVARYIATATWAIMKNKTKYVPYSWRKMEK